jgi:hypothetical protein
MQLSQAPGTRRSSTSAAAPACPPSPWSRPTPTRRISGLDASAGMLAVAAQKPWAREGPLRLRRRHGPRRQRPPRPLRRHPHGLRHPQHARRRPVPRPPARLLRPGGTICFHEYSVRDSPPQPPDLERRRPRHHHPRRPPHLPGSDIYRYLRASVNDFDGVAAFEARLARAGFTDVQAPQTMDGWQAGIVHSFLARRPADLNLPTMPTPRESPHHARLPSHRRQSAPTRSPPARPARAAEVVVVGGGIAGVAAASCSPSAAPRHPPRANAELGGRVGAWRDTLADGTSFAMERGFHAFFRQYYNLRALLRRIDPELARLTPVDRLPAARPRRPASSPSPASRRSRCSTSSPSSAARRR